MIYPMMANVILMACLLPFVYKPLPVEHLGLLAVMSLLGFTGGLCVIAAYRHADAAMIAPMQYSQIIWATLFGYVLFGEQLTWTTALGSPYSSLSVAWSEIVRPKPCSLM